MHDDRGPQTLAVLAAQGERQLTGRRPAKARGVLVSIRSHEVIFSRVAVVLVQENSITAKLNQRRMHAKVFRADRFGQ
jgi:hypothetical protein